MLVALVVGSCGAKASGPGSASVATTGLPTSYASLFVPGETTFNAVLAESSDGQHDRRNGEVTCEISKVSRPGRVFTALLRCSGMELAYDVDGTLVGTPEALYRIDGDYDGHELTDRERMLTAVPRKERRTFPEDDTTTIVDEHEGIWCVTTFGNSFGAGHDARGWQLCVSNDRLIGGASFFEGQSHTQELTWGRVSRGSWPTPPVP